MISQRLKALCAATAIGTLSACAAPSSYMGIDISNPTLEIALNDEQWAYIRQRDDLVLRLLNPACVTEDQKVKDTSALSESQISTCKDTLNELAALDAQRPKIKLVEDLQKMPLSGVAARAQSGDKQAQLELGIRFEERWRAAVRGTDGKPSRDAEQDLKNARKLYAKAATDSGGTVLVYSPPVGNGTSGRVIPVNAGPKRVGLTEAKRRLEGLE